MVVRHAPYNPPFKIQSKRNDPSVRSLGVYVGRFKHKKLYVINVIDIVYGLDLNRKDPRALGRS